MVNNITVCAGDILYNLCGLAFRVIEVQSQYRFRVQALTPNGRGELVPIGAPCIAGRSDFRNLK